MNFTRHNLMKEFPEATPVNVWDAEGDFRDGVCMIRIAKAKGGWKVLIQKGDFRMNEFTSGHDTKKDAIETAERFFKA